MSIFDRLSRNNDFEETRGFSRTQQAEEPKLTQGGVSVYKPKSYGDVVAVIEHLRKNNPAIVYLDAIKETTAQRVRDILSGAIIALGGSMYEIQPKIFIYTPGGVDVKLD
jgi:FtsZ-interacting cell division protein YlmF